MSVKERLKFYIKSIKLSITAFEDSINVANGYVNSISKSVGVDKIELILENYPKLNLEWLLTGQGEMLKSAPHTFWRSDEEIKKAAPPEGVLVELEQLRKENALQTKIIAVLERENELLREKLEEKSVTTLKSTIAERVSE